MDVKALARQPSTLKNSTFIVPPWPCFCLQLHWIHRRSSQIMNKINFSSEQIFVQSIAGPPRNLPPAGGPRRPGTNLHQTISSREPRSNYKFNRVVGFHRAPTRPRTKSNRIEFLTPNTDADQSRFSHRPGPPDRSTTGTILLCTVYNKHSPLLAQLSTRPPRVAPSNP